MNEMMNPDMSYIFFVSRQTLPVRRTYLCQSACGGHASAHATSLGPARISFVFRLWVSSLSQPIQLPISSLSSRTHSPFEHRTEIIKPNLPFVRLTKRLSVLVGQLQSLLVNSDQPPLTRDQNLRSIPP